MKTVSRGETIKLVCDFSDVDGAGDDPSVSRAIRITDPGGTPVIVDATMTYDDIAGRWVYTHKAFDSAMPGRWEFEAIGTDGSTPNVIMGQGEFAVKRRVGGYVAPVPKVIYWRIASTSDHDTVTAIWEQFLEFGANSLPLCNHSYTINRVIADRTDDAYLDNFLTVQTELGDYPIQMPVDYGYHNSWSGADPFIWADDELTPQIWRRDGLTMLEDEHLPVYHTNVADAADAAGGLKNLLDANMAAMGLSAGDYKNAVRYLHCPGYRETTHLAALAKIEEAVKWYSTNVPVAAVNGASEIYANANYVSSRIALAIGIADVPHAGFEGCTRCGSAAGYCTNKNTLAREIAASVRTYAPNALVCNDYVYDIGTADRNSASYWELGSASNFNVPMCAHYGVTYDSTTPLYGRTVYTTGEASIQRYKDLIAIGQSKGNQYWTGMPVGAYIYLSQRLDPYDYTAGYMTYDQMYKVCYYFASLGAIGFALWPGYSGRDKDPATYPPGTDSYTAMGVADDAAALIVYPAMHQAIADWAS